MSEDLGAEPPQAFSGAPMHEYFCRVADVNESTTIPAANPADFEHAAPAEPPTHFSFDGQQRSSMALLSETDTAALVLVQNGKVRYECYELTGGPHVPWLSMSVAKSFIGALVGIAIDEGHIAGLDAAASDYIDVEPGSAYDGTSIRDILQMSSGARWTEDYNDPTSDIFRLSAIVSGQGTFDRFVAECVREYPPGTVCRYNSADTQALATVLIAATGRSLSDYMSEKLFTPLGMTCPGHWVVDSEGREAAGFGLSMTARDYAKLGELYRLGGLWNGTQIVPHDYVRDSISITSEHTGPGRVVMSSEQWDFGYGYQWWLPGVDKGEFVAIGVYNQFIYVHPPSGSVLVKLSANRAYGTSTEERTNRDLENVAFLRAFARSVA